MLFNLFFSSLIFFYLTHKFYSHNHKFYIKGITNLVFGDKMENQLESKIRKTLENVKPWQRVPTSLEGVFLIKAPTRGDQESVMVEINPLDELGRPIKRRGIFIQRKVHLERFLDVMQEPRLKEFLDTLDSMAGSVGEEKVGTLEI